MQNLQLFKAGINHIAILRELSITTFLDTYAQYNTEEDMQSYIAANFSEEKLRSDVESDNSDFYFAMDGEMPIGYIKVNYAGAQTDVNDAESLELERIYVLKQHQGKRAGQFLLDAAVAIVKSDALKYLWLGVWDKNTNAQAFYAKNNFVPFGMHTFLLGDDEQNDILLKLEI